MAEFLEGMPAPLPRSLSPHTLMPVTHVYGPDFYSSALGGADLMLQLLRLAQLDPVASASFLTRAKECVPLLESLRPNAGTRAFHQLPDAGQGVQPRRHCAHLWP